MSNAAVGNIYQQIILDVIEASRVDLEENGVDEGILDELKQVSHFPSSTSNPLPTLLPSHIAARLPTAAAASTKLS